jgi:hypothetical protein
MYSNMHMSPVILRSKNLKFLIYPKDHLPPHVHVLGPDREAKFEIESLRCFFARGFSRKAIREISQYLATKKTILMEAWNEYQN